MESHRLDFHLLQTSFLVLTLMSSLMQKNTCTNDCVLLLLLLHPFNSLFSRTTWICGHQKGKPFWILLEQEMIGWQWHQLDHMQIICASLQTDNHASTSSHRFCRPDALPATQPTAPKHWRHGCVIT